MPYIIFLFAIIFLGYLTKDSSSLFIELLDFISCAIEVNLELQQIVTNFIPNLFGPGKMCEATRDY